MVVCPLCCKPGLVAQHFGGIIPHLWSHSRPFSTFSKGKRHRQRRGRGQLWMPTSEKGRCVVGWKGAPSAYVVLRFV